MTEPSVNNPWHNKPQRQVRERPLRLSPEPLVRMVDGMPCREAAAFLGVNAGTLQKWRNGDTTQGLHYARADRIACHALGMHPASIWGAEWWRL